MKLTLTLAAMLAASTAYADIVIIDECELIQIENSNAFYRADPSCPIGNQVGTDSAPPLLVILPPDDGGDGDGDGDGDGEGPCAASGECGGGDLPDEPVDDGNQGHGNDEDGDDGSNPGKS